MKKILSLVVVFVALACLTPIVKNTTFAATCSHQYTLTTTRKATCEIPGEQKYICKKCGQSQPYAPSVTIPATGHYWKTATYNNSSNHISRCSNCSKTKTQAHTYAITINNSKKGYDKVEYKCSSCSHVLSNRKSVFFKNLTSENNGVIYIVGSDVDEFIDEMSWYLRQASNNNSFDKNNNADYGNRWILKAIRSALQNTNKVYMRAFADEYRDYGTKAIIDCTKHGKVVVFTIEIHGQGSQFIMLGAEYSYSSVDVISAVSGAQWSRKTLR